MRPFLDSRLIASTLALAALLLPAGAAQAQRSDAFTWKLGLQAGGIAFQTTTQDTKVIPSGGAHFLVMARNGGLLVGMDEGFGSDEKTAGGLVLFNDIRRYQAVLMAFPFNSPVEPYFGVGGGITQVVGPRVPVTLVQDPVERADLIAAAKENSASGFITAMVGVQGRWNSLGVFAQYQIASSPPDGKLLKGVMHTLHAGIRVGLGSSKEGIRAGGY